MKFQSSEVYAQDNVSRITILLDSIYSSGNYETVLDLDQPQTMEGPSKPPVTNAPEYPFSEPQDNPPTAPYFPAPKTPLATLLLLVAGLIVVMLALYALVFISKVIPSARRKIDVHDLSQDEAELLLINRDKRVLGTVNQMAAEGKFADAMHALLHSLIDEIRNNIDTTITEANTTREIMKRARISTDAKQSFFYIAEMVEKVFFGNSLGSQSMLDSCIHAYQSFFNAYYGRI